MPYRIIQSRASKRATGLPSPTLARLGKSGAKEMTKETGLSENIIKGKDNSYLKQYYYQHQIRPGQRPIKKSKQESGTFPGFGRGEVRGPKEGDTTVKWPRKPKRSSVRSVHHERELPNKNTRTKTMYVNGSSRVIVDPPVIPGLK